MSRGSRREQIIDIINREFIGPDPIPGMVQENGEEILTSDSPIVRYIAGVLFPSHIPEDIPSSNGDEGNAVQSDDTPDVPEGESSKKIGASELMANAEEDPVNLSNAFKQSAISLTIAVSTSTNIHAKVTAGTYVEEKDANNNSRYLRIPISWENNGSPLALLKYPRQTEPLEITRNGEPTGLHFVVTWRYHFDKRNVDIYTFSLVNSKESKSTGGWSYKECFFQVGFCLTCDTGFMPLPESRRLAIDDEDYQSNMLLYRDVQSYAIGHGCSAEWDIHETVVKQISTGIFPTYELKPVVPTSSSRMGNITLSMLMMSDLGDQDKTFAELKTLCDFYRRWIDGIESKIRSLSETDATTACRHVTNCRQCLGRMEDGIRLLKENNLAMKAFQYMNRVMLLQQLHYNMPLRKWEAKDKFLKLDNAELPIPDVLDEDTWYGDRSHYGKWRPFQLAFILINLRSMLERRAPDRRKVDLIWFPTGGGKTEAYLGLSAYTIFIRRLMDSSDAGTAILMRYTLRLLTAQQYDRAAAMICACETIRQENETELGKSRITIGLWVGADTTPNSTDAAIKAWNKLMRNGDAEENPFVMLKCPWCGAQMGPVSIGTRQWATPGYERIIHPKQAFIFRCGNVDCAFSKINNPLPLTVIDDVIYNEPPTLLLGTVDKFAMLPYRPKAQRIFGYDEGTRHTPPDLIIQDELHLISGPLGSMVGHYETLIHELCTDRRNGVLITPKVIASTATISRAREQCHALYNCGKDNIVQFPPSGIDSGDSFFAIEDLDQEGRMYVGLLAAAAKSMATTMIRLYAALLYAGRDIIVDDEKERDPYWTNLGYFNSLRELGQARTWASADINEYLHTIYKRRREDMQKGYREHRRYIYECDELTSRQRSDKIPMLLQQLGMSYTGAKDEHPLDICLATNMISVGVDIQRLGLMTVAGQPKTTSEYIQATSRVGRRSDAPGLIFVAYNPGKPRDKSHYEHFITYHSRLYSHVEPTSVTPFSALLRDRALHAIAIGLIRLHRSPRTYNDVRDLPTDEEISFVLDIIRRRVDGVDREETEYTVERVREVMELWKAWMPEKYQYDYEMLEPVPLMYHAGSLPNPAWGPRGFSTPTSMRSVDTSSEVQVMFNHYQTEE